MSFGAPQSVKNAQNTESGIIPIAEQNSTNANNAGTTALNTGSTDVTSGTNFFNTLLNGNSANTAATLAPNIAQNRAQTQNTLQSLSTLMPRGGGRSSTLFGASYAPAAATTNLFNQGRTTAATTLPQIGLGEQGVGTNLFNVGNTALNTASGTAQNAVQNATQQQQIMNQLFSGIGGTLGSLALAPVTGGGSLFGNLFSGSGTPATPMSMAQILANYGPGQ